MSFACLLAMVVFIASHLPEEFKTLADAPLLLRLLVKGVYVGSMLQALFMIPVAAAAHTLGRLRSPLLSQLATVAGIGALYPIWAIFLGKSFRPSPSIPAVGSV